MNTIESILKGIKEGTKHMNDLVKIGADTFFGIAVAEQFELSTVEARECASKYADVADAVSKVAQSGDQASWRNTAADLRNHAKGNFVRR
tara:strand:- start:559 stop:828 length:270 start_codon:yes stop_codon:yes gene_type:complete